jgi:hypothetical protein
MIKYLFPLVLIGCASNSDAVVVAKTPVNYTVTVSQEPGCVIEDAAYQHVKEDAKTVGRALVKGVGYTYDEAKGVWVKVNSEEFKKMLQHNLEETKKALKEGVKATESAVKSSKE